MIAVVYHNWGRWVADCPTGCGNAEEERPPRHVPVSARILARLGATVPMVRPGGLTRSGFACSFCGCVAGVAWPGTPEEIIEALTVRPVHARNWLPWETVENLRVENVEHGLVA